MRQEREKREQAQLNWYMHILSRRLKSHEPNLGKQFPISALLKECLWFLLPFHMFQLNWTKSLCWLSCPRFQLGELMLKFVCEGMHLLTWVLKLSHIIMLMEQMPLFIEPYPRYIWFNIWSKYLMDFYQDSIS